MSERVPIPGYPQFLIQRDGTVFREVSKGRLEPVRTEDGKVVLKDRTTCGVFQVQNLLDRAFPEDSVKNDTPEADLSSLAMDMPGKPPNVENAPAKRRKRRRKAPRSTPEVPDDEGEGT